MGGAAPAQLGESCLVTFFVRRSMPLLLVLLAVVSVPCSSDGRTGSDPKNVILATLAADKSSFSLFEPVTATLVVQNRTQNDITASVNLDRSLRFTVRAPDGLTKHIAAPPTAGGIWVPTDLVVPAGGSFRKSLLLNEWIDFRKTGTYEIRVSLIHSGFEQRGHLAEEGRPCTIQILPADVASLDEECRRLSRVALDVDAERASRAARALSFVQHEVCIDDLKSLLEGSFHGKVGAIKALVGIGSEAAIRTLVEQWDSLRWDEQATARSEAVMKGLGPELDEALLESGKRDKAVFEDDTH